MRRFSGRLIVAALAIVGGYFAARALGLKLPEAGEGASEGVAGGVSQGAELASTASDGNALISRALEQLERWPYVSARFRQIVRVEDEPLSGSGEYWQRGVGNERRTCWQWQTLVEDHKAVFRQVYDKDSHLWTDCRFPQRRTVTKVDMVTLRRALNSASDAAGQGRAGERAEELEVRARGGLSQLVAELRHCFTFGAPAAAAVDGQPMLAIVGQWREEALAREWPELTPDSTGDWPGHLPHHVVVKLGQRDFFPYAVEYRREADAGLVGSMASAADPLARYEFFDVRFGVVTDDRLFEFTATDVDWHDVTARALERLRPPKPAAEVAVRDEGWRQYQ